MKWNLLNNINYVLIITKDLIPTIRRDTLYVTDFTNTGFNTTFIRDNAQIFSYKEAINASNIIETCETKLEIKL